MKELQHKLKHYRNLLNYAEKHLTFLKTTASNVERDVKEYKLKIKQLEKEINHEYEKTQN